MGMSRKQLIDHFQSILRTRSIFYPVAYRPAAVQSDIYAVGLVRLNQHAAVGSNPSKNSGHRFTVPVTPDSPPSGKQCLCAV
ncbi:MAG: hypothetical protein M2R45_01013 [Verrucomicrobia subdivision 3 bacterium]|nr:hypothetical protein [Limisphaerales bacterium]MCS1414125.1 hypothetical protein [Limisphaerales bacterium]